MPDASRDKPQKCTFCAENAIGYVYLDENPELACISHVAFIIRARREIGQMVNGTT